MANKLITALILITSACAAGCVADDDSDDQSTSTQALSLPANAKTAFFFFVHKGLTKRQSAGIVGNFMQESGVDPHIFQLDGGPGRGIAQWSAGGRWDTDFHDNVAWFAARRGTSRWGLHTQLAFTWYELKDVGGYGLHALRDTVSIRGATIVFQNDFEGCGQCDSSRRIAFAHDVFDAYAALADIEPRDSEEWIDEATAPVADEQLDSATP